MKVFVRFLSGNWPYMIMAIFIAAVGVMMLLHQGDDGVPEKPEDTYRIDMYDQSKIDQRQDKLENMMNNNLPGYLMFIAANMSLYLIFFLGVFMNIQVFQDIRKKRFVIQRSVDPGQALWGAGDVVRVALMFYSFGFLFLAVEEGIVKALPALDNKNMLFMINATVLDAAGIIFVLNFVLLIYRQKLEMIGITLKNWKKNVLYGLAGYISIIPALFLTMIITAVILAAFKYAPPVQPIVNMLLKEKQVSVLVYSSIFAAIAGPIMEEIFFRGFMYNAFKKKIGVFWGIMATSFIFSSLHAHVIGLVPIMILGALLAYLYERTGSLIPSITVHVCHNLASVLLVFLLKGIEL